MDTLERLLRDHPFLAGMREEWLSFVVGCAANVRFAEGQYLVHAGAKADVLHLVRRGRVALEIDVPARGVVELETLEAGDILGISWLFPPHRWTLDARAVDTVTALAFDADCLRGKMEADPVFGYQLSKRLLKKVAVRLERVRLQRVDLYRTEP